MNIPTRFHCGGYTVKVRVVSQRTLDREHGPGVADADYCRQKRGPVIRLSAALDDDEQVEAFVHEVGHCWSDIILGRGNGSEIEAQAIGTALWQLLRAL